MKSGIWNRSSHFGSTLAGKQALIIGYGRLGRRISDLLRVFGAEVSAWGNRTCHDADVAWVDNLKAAISRFDLIYLCLPSTPETKGILDEEHLSAMRPDSFLINTARGELINEHALYELLKSHKIAGAAIDVWQEEPYYNHALARLDNVIATPHIGGNTAAVHTEMASQLLHELQARILSLKSLTGTGGRN